MSVDIWFVTVYVAIMSYILLCQIVYHCTHNAQYVQGTCSKELQFDKRWI